MRYVVYYRTKMNTSDSINCIDKIERDMWLKSLNKISTVLGYAKVYKSGEYGKVNFLRGNWQLM